MEATLPEILMLLGDKVVKIHEKDKEISILNNRVQELRNRIESIERFIDSKREDK